LLLNKVAQATVSFSSANNRQTIHASSNTDKSFANRFNVLVNHSNGNKNQQLTRKQTLSNHRSATQQEIAEE